MAVQSILEFPHKILRRKARKVRKIDRAINVLADDLVDTLIDSGGVGLAANQIGSLHRLIAINLPEENDVRIYINPEIIHREGEREVEEGCLSVPGYKGIITRSIWVKVRGLERNSDVFRLRAEGLLAQIFEHEIDHLNGILYFDHLKEHQVIIKDDPHIQPEANSDSVDHETSLESNE